MKRNKTRKFTMLRMLRNKKGVALIWSYLLSVSLLTMLTSFYTVTTWDIKNVSFEAQRNQAFYLAEAGIDQMLVQIKAGNFSNISETNLGGLGNYQVTYNSNDKSITSIGKVNGIITQSLVATVGGLSNGLPPGSMAALTVGNVDISGNFYIHGGNHNSSGLILNDGNGLPGLAHYGNDMIKWPANVRVGTEGAEPAYPAAPSAELSLDSNADIHSINAVFGLSDSSTALASYIYDVVPSKALNNEIYYFKPTTAGKTTPIVDFQGGNGIFIAEGDIELTGSFSGLVIVHNASTITFHNVTILGGFVATAPNTNSYVIREVADDSKDPNGSSILFSKDVLADLPEISGTTYGNVNPYISGWSDNSNGNNRFIHTVTEGVIGDAQAELG